eukprot:CAMPEP_0185845192 /NCGR_PEP_ID=MMETSP1354-20130828/1218_1 /TAXON_ID=708628 /ORGANISM="Erythrolobus madagascarensis, Strain CCMP3276" /LENGTH=305 /DNA_ID=CAMNT_0028545087 /DNA_START=31 /DNA_END=948 /DNA_ORIENTATION=-
MVAVHGKDDIKTLLQEHEHSLLKLKAKVKDVAPDYMDEIWLLRYLLSSKYDVDKAALGVQKAVEYRKTNDSWLRAAREEHTVAPDDAAIAEYIKVGRHKRTTDGNLVFIVRLGISRPSDAASAFTHEQLLKRQAFLTEQNYWICDRYSRETGKLSRVVSIIDMTGVSLSSGHTDRRFFKILGENSHNSEFLHPQLLAKMVIYNPPGIFKVMFSLAKLFVSQRTIEKVAVCTGGGGGLKKIKTAEKCPVAGSLFAQDSLPSFLGGDCTCAESGLQGCVANFSNAQRTQIPLPSNHAQRLSERKSAK